MTLVSVVVCSRNSSDTLDEAISSALVQTLPWREYEVLLVDDASTDRTSELAGIYQKRFQHLRYLRMPATKGRAAAFNYALEASQGKYFIQVAPGDALHHEALSWLVDALESSEADFAYCDRYELSLADGAHRLVRLEPLDLLELSAGGAILRSDLLRQISRHRSADEGFREVDLLVRYLRMSGRAPVRVPKPLYYCACGSKSAKTLLEERQDVKGYGLAQPAVVASYLDDTGLTAS